MHLRSGLSALVFLLSTLPLLADDTSPCPTHDWFAPKTDRISLLCQGILDSDFERRKDALHNLRQVIKSSPTKAEAYQAHETLLSFYFRAGQYREALKEADAMLALKPDSPDVIEVRPLLLGLSNNPNQSGKSKHFILPKSNVVDGNPHFPVLANGHAALWFMDTGANISTMSDAEAKALGLIVHPVSTKLGDVSGTMTAINITEVDKLTIGKTQLRHVAFVVLPHTQPPFDDIPIEQQALLGIQVLRALGSIRIDKADQIEIGGPTSLATLWSPLVYYQNQPVIQMSFQGKALSFTLDTGAVHTTLNPPFAVAFPETMSAGEKREYALTGLGGNTTQHSLSLNSLPFKLAGRTIVLSPATVLLEKTADPTTWAAGNLGYDLVRQTAPFTIDFRAMRFSTED